jgi:spore maturation protein CgeB
MRLLIVGMDAAGHVGRFFLEGARDTGLDVRIADVSGAMVGNPWIRRLLWRLQKRPIQLEWFSRQVLGVVATWKPDFVLSTGLCPLTAAALAEIRKAGAKVVNYSTDDPWNPSHRSSWFLKALPEYDHVFSTRKANIADFKRIGCRSVSWLPFGYHPAVHHPVEKVEARWQSDVAFVGGADRDRVPMLAQMIREGYKLSLWGGYWERFPETRMAARGMADSETLCKVVGATTCALTLVRRSNRDGHSMRTYEVAAIGGPALAEDTEEHREILGEEGDTAFYFADDLQLEAKTRWLIEHPEEASAMGARLARRIRASPNTYADRLHSILTHAALSDPS